MPEKLNIKLLDCDRREILKLPSGAVHLWFTLYMLENEFNESYRSTRTLAKLMQVNKDTVSKGMNYLLETGWVVNVGATAAERYSNPTPNAHQVPVVRVDDPTKCPKVSDNNPSSEDCPKQTDTCPKVSTVRKSRTKVVGCSCSLLGVNGTCECDMSHVGDALPAEDTKTKSGKPKTKTIPVSVSGKSHSSEKWMKTYDQPKPSDFDDWDTATKAEWVHEHSLDKQRLDKSRLDKSAPPTSRIELNDPFLSSVVYREELPEID